MLMAALSDIAQVKSGRDNGNLNGLMVLSQKMYLCLIFFFRFKLTDFILTRGSIRQLNTKLKNVCKTKREYLIRE